MPSAKRAKLLLKRTPRLAAIFDKCSGTEEGHEMGGKKTRDDVTRYLLLYYNSKTMCKITWNRQQEISVISESAMLSHEITVRFCYVIRTWTRCLNVVWDNILPDDKDSIFGLLHSKQTWKPLYHRQTWRRGEWNSGDKSFYISEITKSPVTLQGGLYTVF